MTITTDPIEAARAALDALREERQRLIARVAEIDALLGPMNRPRAPAVKRSWATGDERVPSREVLAHIQAHPGCTVMDLMRAFPQYRTRCAPVETVKWLAQRGLVRMERGDKDHVRRYHFYAETTHHKGESDG